MPKLNWKILTKKRDSSTQGLPPGKEDLAWVTNTVTLISGEHDAILVDTFLSVQHSKELVDWVAESGKNLATIYVTHAHGDHFFGLKLLLDRFPNARAFATASSVAGMQRQIEPGFIKSFWEPRFPGQVPPQLVAPEILEGDTLYLEGEELKVVELGHTDTSNTTALHVPSIGLVVSGDAVYNNTHPYLAETDENTRNEWLRALDTIEALHPQAVIAGHGVLDPDSSPCHIEETRRYIRDFNSVAASTSTAVELYEKVLALHPNRVNPGSLWATAKALRGNAKVAPVEMKLEVVVIPVASVERSKDFYSKVGWRLDADFHFDNGFRVVQFTPPGSAASVQFGTKMTPVAPGSSRSMYLVVTDIVAAREQLASHGVVVSSVFHAGEPGANFEAEGSRIRIGGPSPDRASYGSFATFSDPDGNSWLLQEVTTRLPGRVESGGTLFASVSDLQEALIRAATAHGEHEKRTGAHDEKWPVWYAAYIVAEQAGKTLPL